jgi:hypothetical protein
MEFGSEEMQTSATVIDRRYRGSLRFVSRLVEEADCGQN